MLSIGLTGGIGSGKSAAGDFFRALSVEVIDADQVVREITRPEAPAYLEIIEVFGPSVLCDDGQIDRKRLGEVVFQQPALRKKLESILHPKTYETMQAQLRLCQADYAILMVPLLIETRQTRIVQRLLVMDTPERMQLDRVRHREGRSKAEIRVIMECQATRLERLGAADDIIDNSGSLNDLRQMVGLLHRYYLSLASSGAYS